MTDGYDIERIAALDKRVRSDVGLVMSWFVTMLTSDKVFPRRFLMKVLYAIEEMPPEMSLEVINRYCKIVLMDMDKSKDWEHEHKAIRDNLFKDDDPDSSLPPELELMDTDAKLPTPAAASSSSSSSSSSSTSAKSGSDSSEPVTVFKRKSKAKARATAPLGSVFDGVMAEARKRSLNEMGGSVRKADKKRKLPPPRHSARISSDARRSARIIESADRETPK